jgi:nucleoside-diphosphate-sugar epimerase
MEFHAIEMLGAPLAKGKKAMIIGRGDRVRNLVSAQDVAELVVWAVESRYEGTLDVVGPHDASPNDDVATIAAVLGSEPKAMHIDPRVAKVLAVVPGRLVPNVGRIIDISLFTDAADRPAEPTELPDGAPVPHRSLTEVTRAELVDEHD